LKPAIIQKNGLYGLTLEFASSFVGAPFLDTINSIVKEEKAKVHITTSQKIMLLDLTEESAKKAIKKLDALGADYKFPKQVYLPRVCVGSAYCRFGLTDTLRFGERIYENFAHVDIPYKLKTGVSGCRASCAHSTFADIGFIGRKSGYSIYAGGKSGINPEQGQVLVKSVTEDNALQIMANIIQLYCKNFESGKKRQRIFHIIKKMGFDKFKSLAMQQ